MVAENQIGVLYLKDLEVNAIIVFGTRHPGGYNLSPGGETAPSTLPEVRAKISASRRGQRPSEETRRKLSAARKGRPAWNKGIPHTEKSKAKISAAGKGRAAWNKGIAMLDSVKMKLIKANVGRTPWNKGAATSAETKAKISASTKGIPHSDAHRANQALANRRTANDPARRALLSKNAKLQWKAPEFRAMMIARHTGAKRSPETRERMRVAQAKIQTRKAKS